jgi:hypothetical protein
MSPKKAKEVKPSKVAVPVTARKVPATTKNQEIKPAEDAKSSVKK